MKFELDKEQLDLLKKWQKKIKKKYKDNYKFREIYQYRFTPTGIGVVITVKHEQSGKKLDLTDVTKW